MVDDTIVSLSTGELAQLEGFADMIVVLTMRDWGNCSSSNLPWLEVEDIAVSPATSLASNLDVPDRQTVAEEDTVTAKQREYTHYTDPFSRVVVVHYHGP